MRVLLTVPVPIAAAGCAHSSQVPEALSLSRFGAGLMDTGRGWVRSLPSRRPRRRLHLEELPDQDRLLLLQVGDAVALRAHLELNLYINF